MVDSQVVNNNSGLDGLGTNATLFVGRTTISGNASGWAVFTGAILNSYGDNYVNGNAGGEDVMPLVATK